MVKINFIYVHLYILNIVFILFISGDKLWTLRVDPVPLLNMSINELKVEMKKSPKFLRTIRSNKAPVILDAEEGMKFEPYNVMTMDLLKKRAELIRTNEKFSQNILTALRENAEEKEQTKSQEDIYAEESIYTKFTSNKDTALFPSLAQRILEG